MSRAFRHFAFALAWWCLLRAAPAAPDPPSPVRSAEKPQVLTAQMRRSGMNMLWLPATVENVKGSLIIDTGSPVTILSEAKYRFLLKGDAHKLPPGALATIPINTLKARTALVHDLSLGGHDLGASLVALVPERYLDEAETFHYANRASNFDGIMGEDFLRLYRAVIDCTRQLLYLNLGPVRKDNLPAVLIPNGWTRVPMAEVDDHFVVPCVINGFTCRLIVDTGSSFTVLDKTLLRAIKVGSHALPVDGGLIGNEMGEQRLVQLHKLQIGDYVADDVQMTALENLSSALVSEREGRTEDTIIGLLGADTLGFNGAIIDLGGNALYLKHLPSSSR